MLCPKCNVYHLNQHTTWSEMMKPVNERVHEYSCQPCGRRWTQEELDNEMSTVQRSGHSGEREPQGEGQADRKAAG